MVGMARRGDNFFGHPHYRKLLEAQVQSTSPTGRVTVNSGTQYEPYSRQHMSFQFLDEMKTFFPKENEADYLLQCCNLFRTGNETFAHSAESENFDPDAYAASLDSKLTKLRLPSVTYPGMVQGVLYDSDFKPATRESLQLPLDFNAATHGLFSSYSDRSSDAVWISLLVRPDHYLGAGHHHADAGMFHFSALGVDWFTQSPFDQAYDGKYFNLVQVDGHSEPESIPGQINGYNGRATYLGDKIEAKGAYAAADLTYAYSYRWLTQPPPIWGSYLSGLGWEVEPNLEVLKCFAGTSHYKMRPWWMTIDAAANPFQRRCFVGRVALRLLSLLAPCWTGSSLPPIVPNWNKNGLRLARREAKHLRFTRLSPFDGDLPDILTGVLQPADIQSGTGIDFERPEAPEK